jgi:hypothetical protein
MRRAPALLSGAEALLALVGGAAALFGTYWDDSWHTDRGRDSLAAPPHLVLYAGVLVALGVAASWARRAADAAGWRAVLRTAGGPRTALVGGAAVLVSAPVDELWHTTYGRDAVLWSPPHLLAVAGSAALTVGLVLGLRRGSTAATCGAALTVGAYVVPVMEYETDVPQFDVALYLPALAAGLALAAPVVLRLVGGRWPFTVAAGAYTLARIAITGGLAAIGHSTPIVPPVLVVAVTADLLRRSTRPGWVGVVAVVAALHAVYVPILRVVPHGIRFDASDVVVSAILGIATVGMVAAGRRAWSPKRLAPGLAAVAVVAFLLLLDARPATAHDPGQGDVVGSARFDVGVDGDHLDVTVLLPSGMCGGGETVVVARRAGATERAAAELVDCTAAATLRVDSPGRWFVYVEQGELEAWVPVETGDEAVVSAVRDVYERPAPAERGSQVLAGVPLVLAAAALFAGASRAAGNQPAGAVVGPDGGTS